MAETRSAPPYFKNYFVPDGLMLILVLDIRSSSRIIQELTLNGTVQPYEDMIEHMKHYLNEKAGAKLRHDGAPWFDLYKFTGDGWILVFDVADVAKGELLPFLRGLTELHLKWVRRALQHVDSRPPKSELGLTFGISRGRVSGITVNGRHEYIGRPINIACRLQKTVEKRNVAHATPAAFDLNIGPLDGYPHKWISVEPMKGIGSPGEPFKCVSIELMAVQPT
jgi:class 3 adenylate cyclase